MLFGGKMLYAVFLVVFCGISVVLGIQVHEDVLEDPTTTMVLPLPKSENMAGNSSSEADGTSSAPTKEVIARQNYEGNSSKFQDNTPQNTNISHFTHHIHIPDTNSQPSIKQFVPSPQLNTWNEKVTLSPVHNHFQPLGAQYKVLHAKVTPVSYKNTQVIIPNSGERGHFVWVPYAAETTTIRNTELPPTGRNPWRWSAGEADNGAYQTEQGTISYGGNYNGWEDLKKKPHRDWPYPYELSDAPLTSSWTTEKIPLETTTLEMEEFPKKQKSNFLSGFSSKNKAPWKKLAHILTAAIPLGLLISALTPQVVYVNPNDTRPPTVNPSLSLYPGRLRSLDADETSSNSQEEARKMKNPLVDFISMFSEANNDVGVNCENRVFCELSRMGAYRDSDVVQKMLWKIANETSDTVAKKTGLIAIFRAIRENKCAIFHCNMHTSTLSLQNADNE